MPRSTKELQALRHERDNWRTLAIYLSEVHAANAQMTLSKKSSPKAEKKRQRLIAGICLDGMKHGCLVGRIASKQEAVAERLIDIFDEYPEQE